MKIPFKIVSRKNIVYILDVAVHTDIEFFLSGNALA